MFYRRKIILAIIELLNGNVEKLQLQKLLFLASPNLRKPPYEFIPYKFGCYSFSAKADLDTMVKKGQLSESENAYKSCGNQKYFSSLLAEDKVVVRNTVMSYGKMSSSTLIEYTYKKHPFFAIKSTIAKDVLKPTDYIKVIESQPNQSETTLFTIGYEGISLEEYLLRLIKNNIFVLVDVRKNAMSMKFGFSKSTLKRSCNNLGIEYLHIPEVGVQSDKRKALNTQMDYDNLFDEYKSSVLLETVDSQYKLLKLLEEKKRIALTCFEAKTCQCHRTHLAEAVAKFPEFKYKLSHI